MRWLRAFVVRVAGLFGKADRESDWHAEFEAHLHMHLEDNLRAGMSPVEARRQALLRLGGLEAVKESLRDRATLGWVEDALKDVRYAARGLRRNPGFAFAAVLSLALGIGASLAIFTVADNLLLRPLPYRDPSRLVMVWEMNTRRPEKKDNVVSPSQLPGLEEAK